MCCLMLSSSLLEHLEDLSGNITIIGKFIPNMASNSEEQVEKKEPESGTLSFK